MDETLLLALVGVAAVGIVAVLAILGRRREAALPPEERPLATSSEGMTLCPDCGAANMWTERNCIACGSRLPT